MCICMLVYIEDCFHFIDTILILPMHKIRIFCSSLTLLYNTDFFIPPSRISLFLDTAMSVIPILLVRSSDIVSMYLNVNFLMLISINQIHESRLSKRRMIWLIFAWIVAILIRVSLYCYQLKTYFILLLRLKPCP